MLGNLAVDGENSFVGALFSLLKGQRDAISIYCQVLGKELPGLRGMKVNDSGLWSQVPGLESRCQHLLLVL